MSSILTRTDLQHSGFVGVIGRPNVGKSTLLNKLVKKKLAIVSSKPQTTRHTIRAVISAENSQMVLIDTPGLHKPQDGLGTRLNSKVRRTMKEVDAVLFLIDGAGGVGRGDQYVARELVATGSPVVLALNKIDLMGPEERESQEKAARALVPDTNLFAISAMTGEGLAELTDCLISGLQPGPKYYPDDILTDQPEAVLVGELVREKLLEATREEVPYALAVEVTEMKKRRRRDLVDVHVRIHVERDSQKGIVIGKEGRVLADIGRRARLEIEGLLGSPVYLDLTVRVTKDWRRRASKVEELGY